MNVNMDGIRQNVRDEIDIALTRLVLGALEEVTAASGRPTRARLARALARKPAEGQALPGPSLLGLLDRFRMDDIRCMIEVLEERSLVEATSETRFRLALTAEGRHFLRGFLPAPVGLVERVLDRRDDRSELHQALRRMRADLAREGGVPPYRIFDNRTLRLMAARRPRSIGDLEDVPGIGPAKTARFGLAILECVARHAGPALAPAAPPAPATLPLAEAPSLEATSVGEPRPRWLCGFQPRGRPGRFAAG